MTTSSNTPISGESWSSDPSFSLPVRCCLIARSRFCVLVSNSLVKLRRRYVWARGYRGGRMRWGRRLVAFWHCSLPRRVTLTATCTRTLSLRIPWRGGDPTADQGQEKGSQSSSLWLVNRKLHPGAGGISSSWRRRRSESIRPGYVFLDLRWLLLALSRVAMHDLQATGWVMFCLG